MVVTTESLLSLVVLFLDVSPQATRANKAATKMAQARE
jgi:hypothetical protein